MSIRRKTFLTMIAATLILFAALFVMSRMIIQNRFVRLEQEYAVGQGEQVLRDIESSFDRLHELGKALGRSDGIYRFANDPSIQLGSEELTPEFLSAQNIQISVLIDRNARMILGNMSIPGGQVSNNIPSDLLEQLNKWNLEIEVGKDQSHHEGFFHSAGGDYLLIFQSILKKDGSGPQAGWLVLGRSLQGSELTTLNKASGQELRLVLPEQFPEELKQSGEIPGSVFISPVNGSADRLPVYTILNDPAGKPSAALAFELPREIYLEGQSSVNSLIVAIGISCLLLLLTLLAVFEILIVRPIVHLAQLKDCDDDSPAGLIHTVLPNLEDVIKPMEQVAQDAKRVRDENLVRRELFSALVEQAKEGFAVIDPKNLCVMDVNATLCKRIGKTTAEINGMALFDLLEQVGAVLSAPEIEKIITKIKAGEQIHRIVTILPKNGTNKEFVRIHGGTIMVADQEFIYLFVQDVTVEVQLQQALEEKLQETLLLNRVIGAVSSTLDLNQIFAVICEELAVTLKVPQAALALLSNDGTELNVVAEYATEGRPSACGDVIPVKNNPSTQWVLQNQKPLAVTDILAGAQEPALKEMMIRRGTRSMLILPLIVRNHVVGTLGLDSIVERIFTENEIDLAQNAASAASRAIEIARLYDNLQKELAQRQHAEKERAEYLQQLRTYTEEIALKNEELASARDEALEASRLKSEFLATMSHEIRTPMNAIIGMTELLIDTNQTKEQQDYTEIVRESAQVLLSLINDILDFSKIEAGKLSLEAIDFEPLEMIETAVQMFTPKAQEKSLSLMAYISPTVPRVVVGDPLRFRQIITNLISNAVKFTDQGEVLVNLELEKVTDQHTFVKLTISDTGIGLTDLARKRLFQPFTQADGSTTRKYGGSGLGLAITKSLVELMGGEIGVDSEIGQGSKFWCIVPFEKSTWRETEDKRTLRVNLEGLHVLVVDDNPTHREIIRRYLDSWGMQGELAESARVALEMLNVANLKKDPYDLAVLDFHMPEMDGMQLAQVIRENTEYKDLRLILLTAFDQRGQGDLALKEGFSAYLTKPVKQSLLFDTIANAVTAEGVAATTEEHSNEESSPSLESIEIREKRTARILLAEDNLPNQMLTVAQLQKLGYEVDTVVNGLLALQKIITYSDRYQLVLMDCQMPQMDGFAATREIRAYEGNNEYHIPIIAMTANAMQGDREACLAAGMDDYISKPVTIENLKKVIENWLQRRAPQGATEMPMDDSLNGSPLDESIVAGIRELQMEGEPDLLTELIDIYLIDAPKLFDKIETGIQTHDNALFRQGVHSLKGTSGNLGARDFSTLCGQVETLIVNNQIEEAIAMKPRLEEEFERVKVALKALRIEN